MLSSFFFFFLISFSSVALHFYLLLSFLIAAIYSLYCFSIKCIDPLLHQPVPMLSLTAQFTRPHFSEIVCFTCLLKQFTFNKTIIDLILQLFGYTKSTESEEWRVSWVPFLLLQRLLLRRQTRIIIISSDSKLLVWRSKSTNRSKVPSWLVSFVLCS